MRFNVMQYMTYLNHSLFNSLRSWNANKRRAKIIKCVGRKSLPSVLRFVESFDNPEIVTEATTTEVSGITSNWKRLLSCVSADVIDKAELALLNAEMDPVTRNI